jgi:hypothetical protein
VLPSHVNDCDCGIADDARPSPSIIDLSCAGAADDLVVAWEEPHQASGLRTQCTCGGPVVACGACWACVGDGWVWLGGGQCREGKAWREGGGTA